MEGIKVLSADVQRDGDTAVCKMVARVVDDPREFTFYARIPGDEDEDGDQRAIGSRSARIDEDEPGVDGYDALLDALVAASGETEDVVPGVPPIYSKNPAVHLIAYAADERLCAIATAALAEAR
ncbi:hypothetical protein BX589_101110 [Paraburkholderia fungorum]|jgi:hypothetical protein|uniref:hypothetical protein n=1 Tax=Paraburkholderia fungorum TaxID=134537 RepID=UPI000D069B09|nr:hypothetical protein [Paraburkholderia fungorum]PRZ56460.1 hypothetical protein BX589_101110 [Paraburkholderia fungorum]